MYEDNLNDPNMDAVGTDQDANAYLDNTDDQDADAQSTPSKSEEQLRQERATAVREAINNSKKLKEARAEKEYLSYENKVLRNPDSLIEVYEKNPAMADEIARNNWGISYQELIQKASSQENTKNTADWDENAIEQMVRKTLEKEKERTEKEKIEDLPVQFFLETDIDPRGPTFKTIMKEYQEFQPKSVKQAEKLLNMLYLQHTQAEEEDMVTFSPPTIGRKSSAGNMQQPTNKRQVSSELRTYMESKYGKEKVNKFLKKS